MASQTEQRELIIQIYKENPPCNQKTIAKKAKVGQATVSRVLKKFNDDLTVARKPGSGRKKGFESPKKRSASKRDCCHSLENIISPPSFGRI